MFKVMFVTASIALLFVACSDNSAVTTGPTVLNQLPRASDGISPTDYINMHNLSIDLPEGFDPQDTIFAADYIVNGEECEGGTITITTTDSMGNKSTTSYCYYELCGHYLIIYGPNGIGAMITYEGCPDSLLPDGYAKYRGRNTTYTGLDAYLDSILH